MDPNAALAEARERIQHGRALGGRASRAQLREAFDDLAASTEALDDWLSHGGVAPQAWTAASTAVESIEEQIVKEALAALRCGAGRAAAVKILRQGFLTTERLCHTEAPAEQVL